MSLDLSLLAGERQQGASSQQRGLLDARGKLVATLAFVVALVVTPPGWWRTMAAEGLVLAVVLAHARVRPGPLIRQAIAMAPLVVFVGLMVGLSHPSRRTLGLGGVASAIILKNGMALTAMLAMAQTTPFPQILTALRQLRVPAPLVVTLHFMYRYLHVLADELSRMVQARRARNFRRSGKLDWGLLSGLIGVLFLRSLERGERVHSAMLARGWDGTLRTLDED